MEEENILSELIQLSHELGMESRQLAILGEGNTSADCGDGTFWVKASGSQLGTIDENGFSRVHFQAVFELLKKDNLTDLDISDGLRNALVNKTQRKPSVETFLHALCLTQPEIAWIGHTHPVSVNQILCSRAGAEPFLRHLFPDEIVVCGGAPLVIPYVDPGLVLAKTIQASLERYLDQYGHAPRMILMVNHGLVVLGKTAREVLNITQMADKFAKILYGTYAFGGPGYLPAEHVERIENRLDERDRRKALT